MSIINTTIIDNQFVFIGSHVAIQVNPTFLALKMPHQLNVPKAIQVLLLLLLLLATMTYNQVQSFRINYLADQSYTYIATHITDHIHPIGLHFHTHTYKMLGLYHLLKHITKLYKDFHHIGFTINLAFQLTIINLAYHKRPLGRLLIAISIRPCCTHRLHQTYVP